MINYGCQYIDKNDINNIIKTLKSKFLTQGPLVEKFESRLKFFFGSKYCTAVSSGTAALHIAGLALGWNEKSVIITTPLTFVATANSVEYCKAKLDLADIKNDGTIDPASVEKLILKYLKKKQKVVTVIGVDYYGNCCDWESLYKLKQKYKFKLINDNCHALGSKYKKTERYAVKYADIVTQSFHPVKNITTGEGGCLITNKKDLKIKFDNFRSHGMVTIKNQVASLKKQMKFLGYNYRISDINCALGITQLNKIKKFLDKRKLIAKIYNKSFSKYSNIFTIPEFSKECEPAYHLYPLRINFKKLKINKKKLINVLSKKYKINLQIHYNPIYNQPYFKKKYNFNKNSFPITNDFFYKVVSLPIFYSLKNKDIYQIVKIIIKLCK